MRIQREIIANKKIEVAVPVVVEKSTACAPANLRLVKAGFMRDIGKRAISVVAEKNVVSPETAKQVIPSIIVVIAYADTGLPTGTRQSRFFGDVGKRAIAVVLVQMRGRRFSWRPMRVQPISIGEIDVQPSVMVIVEKGQSASFGLNDGSFMVDAAPHVGDWSARLAAPHPQTGPESRSGSRDRGLHQVRVSPVPQGSCKSLCQRAAEHEER